MAGGRGQAVGQQVEQYRREPLAEGATLKSGELVEVELEIDSKNDYEYLVFEDYKAAGFEAAESAAATTATTWGPTSSSATSAWPSSPGRWRAASTASRTAFAQIPALYHALPAPGPRPCTHRS